MRRFFLPALVTLLFAAVPHAQAQYLPPFGLSWFYPGHAVAQQQLPSSAVPSAAVPSASMPSEQPPIVSAPSVEPGVPLPASIPDGSFQNGLVAGASAYALRPFLDNNVASISTSGLAGPSPQTMSTSFDWKMQPAVAVWAGYSLAGGFGVRARWFHLDADSETMNASLSSPAAASTSIGASPTLPALALPLGANPFRSPGLLLSNGVGQDVLAFSSSLRIDAWDAEATYTWRTGGWDFIVAGGGRALTMAQAYHARLNNNPGDGVTSESQSLDFTHGFNGGGPTVDFQATWRIPQTNLGLFANVRGSLLVGHENDTTDYAQIVHDPLGLSNTGHIPVSFAIGPTAINASDQVLPVAELELGIDYGRNWRRTRWSVRTSLVEQTYFGAGNASRLDGNLGLFGGKISFGLNY